ncbi:hypothetical protein [Caudoviricetes sp.]|nr:hypothetical protein [Caudoviricetes sp.]
MAIAGRVVPCWCLQRIAIRRYGYTGGISGSRPEISRKG